MITTFQISQDQIIENFFKLEYLDDLADCEFLQINFTDAPDDMPKQNFQL